MKEYFKTLQASVHGRQREQEEFTDVHECDGRNSPDWSCLWFHAVLVLSPTL